MVIATGYNATDIRGVDVNAAYTFCFWVTIAQAVPYLLLVVAVILLVIAMLNIPFQLVAASTQCIMQAIVYTHIQDQNED